MATVVSLVPLISRDQDYLYQAYIEHFCGFLNTVNGTGSTLVIARIVGLRGRQVRGLATLEQRRLGPDRLRRKRQESNLPLQYLQPAVLKTVETTRSHQLPAG